MYHICEGQLCWRVPLIRGTHKSRKFLRNKKVNSLRDFFFLNAAIYECLGSTPYLVSTGTEYRLGALAYLSEYHPKFISLSLCNPYLPHIYQTDCRCNVAVN
jgi:hypothetical protein